MASTTIQFRTDDVAKLKAISICEKLGIDLPSYLRMCISRLNSENGIPFSMNVNDLSVNKGIEAMKAASTIANNYGIADMSLEEINNEIAAVRETMSE